MPRRKPTPERKSRSGSYLPDNLRGKNGGATERVVVRCSPEIAERSRRAAAASHRTLAEVMSLGVEIVEMLQASAEHEEMTLEEYVTWLERERRLGARIEQAHTDADAAEWRRIDAREREQGR